MMNTVLYQRGKKTCEYQHRSYEEAKAMGYSWLYHSAGPDAYVELHNPSTGKVKEAAMKFWMTDVRGNLIEVKVSEGRSLEWPRVPGWRAMSPNRLRELLQSIV